VTRDQEDEALLVAHVFGQALEALDRGALLVLSRSGEDLAWSVVPPASDLELGDVRYIHAIVGGGVVEGEP